MSLTAILAAIESDTAAEAARTLEAAATEAAGLRADAETLAGRRIERALADAEPALRAEAARLVNAARLRLLRRRAELGSEHTEAAWRSASAALDTIVAEGGPRWQAALRTLAGEALEMVGPNGVVAIREPDAPAIADLVAARAGRLETRAAGAPPGLAARSADGRLEVDGTIATRLDRARTSLTG